MKVLVINAGSTSIKFDIFDTEANMSSFFGEVKNILVGATMHLQYGVKKIEKALPIKTHQEAVPYINAYINSLGLTFDAIGFRAVHGGSFTKHLLLDDNVLNQLKSLNPLAPLHNPITVDVIQSYRANTNKPICLVFDTVFYNSLQPLSYTYPIPKAWRDLGVRKYGFHGISHEYLNNKVNEFGHFNRVITCHLGAGSSITATLNNKPIDTSMGFTPMSGLMMATRSGDIDPLIINYLMSRTNMTIEQISNSLTYDSGLQGLTGISDNKLVEIEALKGNKDCILALNMYVKKILEHISSYYLFLGGVDALVFSGGIGENSAILRKMIVSGLGPLGFKLNEAANNSPDKEKQINDLGTPIYVIATNESKVIAKYTEQVIKEVMHENNKANI